MRYHKEPGASWLRFAPQHYYCRNCGAEIRRTLTLVGYVVWALILGLFAVAAFAIFTPWGTLPAMLWALACIPLSLVTALWGTRWGLVHEGRSERHAL